MAAEEYKTLREVGVAMDGIRQQFGLFKWILGGSVAIGVAVSGFFYTKLDDVEDATARIEATLLTMNEKLDKLQNSATKADGNLGDIKRALETAQKGSAAAILSSAYGAAAYLKSSGFKVHDLSDLRWRTVPLSPDYTLSPGEAFVFTADPETAKKLNLDK